MDHRKPFVSPPHRGGSLLAIGVVAVLCGACDAPQSPVGTPGGAWVLWNETATISRHVSVQWTLRNAYPTYDLCVAAKTEELARLQASAADILAAGVATVVGGVDGTVAYVTKGGPTDSNPKASVSNTPKCLPESVDPREPAQR